ncbi:unnamed protein product [Bursaphelenchus okinawaensis]|uniref:Uncharacterized protein n=1 Tax=Bursaphelenchus okinawaensis TaxID=465554 RepID=A0A811K317_9BILA|nr:unnamed protein product [Bursaphelenchus okinawaensis]CAG9090638.1 unnamed protein product [Bursaphelenchus okinawaensis]
MVCVPCFILPVLVVIYVRFIQPLILRFVPQAWKTKLDAWLYPTCPLDLKKNRKAKATGDCCAEDENIAKTEEPAEIKPEEVKKNE